MREAFPPQLLHGYSTVFRAIPAIRRITREIMLPVARAAASSSLGHHACTSPLFAQLSNTQVQHVLPDCWAVIGVLSKLADVEGRAFIRTSARRFAATSICTRFVVGETNELSVEARSAVYKERSLLTDVFSFRIRDDDCGRKTFVWFEHALREFPRSAWIGKADTDTFVQLRALEADLLSLTADAASDPLSANVIVGQFSWAASWSFDHPPEDDSASMIRAGKPCGQVVQMQDVVPRWANVSRNVTRRRKPPMQCNVSLADGRLAGPASGRYPFAVGPIYMLSSGLARRTFLSEAVLRFVAQQSFHCAAEDATVGYAVHMAALARGETYMLAHMTTIKLHGYSGRVAFNGGPPSHESVAVHYLKVESFPNRFRRRLRLLWTWLSRVTARSADRDIRCWPLIRFRWHPAAGTVHCLDPRIWHLYRWKCTTSSSNSFCRPAIYPAVWPVNVRSPVWTCDAANATLTDEKAKCPARCDARSAKGRTYVCD